MAYVQNYILHVFLKKWKEMFIYVSAKYKKVKVHR